MTGARAAVGLLICLLHATPASARELFRHGDFALQFSGQIRELFLVTRGTDADEFTDRLRDSFSPLVGNPDLNVCISGARFADCPAFKAAGRRDVWQSLTRVRTRFDLEAGPHVSAKIVYDHEILAGILDSFESRFGGNLVSESYLDLEDDIEFWKFDRDSDHARWRHLLYRAFVRVESRHLEVVVGRQRIPWGVGRLWNPIDRFNAIPPLALEADQSAGIDALDVKLRFSGFSYLELVAAPADGPDDSYAARLHGVIRDVDYSLMFGSFEEAWTAGFDLAGNLGGSAVRLEAVWADPDRDVWRLGHARPSEPDAFWQVVASLDYNFDVGNGLYFLVEHFYNEAALGFGEGEAGNLAAFFETTNQLPADVQALVPALPPGFAPFAGVSSRDRLGGSRVISFARHQTGFQLGYEFTPLVRGDLLGIYDWSGHSSAWFPSVRVTPTGSLEITLGAQLFSGSDRSQYGSAQRLFYVLTEFFF